MCLAVPLEIKEIIDSETAVVQQGEVKISINVSLLADPAPGEYVIVHAGYAIEKIDLQEAGERIDMIKEMHNNA